MALQGRKILFTLLNWGIGHAARSTPLIKALQENGADVLIGSDGKALEFLKGEFPHTHLLQMPSNEIRYGRKGVAAALLPQLPAFFKQIKNDQSWVDQLVQIEKIDLIISDNRYGAFHQDIPSVLITHQLNIQAPKLAKPMIDKMLKSWVSNFNEVWVPDEKNGLAGALTISKLDIPIRHLGVLSRMKKSTIYDDFEKIELLILLSGPEPQRSILEAELWRQLEGVKKKVVFIRGTNKAREYTLSDIKTFDLLDGKALAPLLTKAERIVCRSGYSTLMDLAQMGKPALLIPTPGQTEQEYLGKYFQEKNWAIVQSQKNINLSEFINNATTPFIPLLKMDLKNWIYQVSVLLE